ncbi:D-alanine--D-alanine ligase [Domibacillus epiphyticus]|uniref:D-alanine--D-alanine ligase n=1 Tax=Domibacillus epiphyticus TaxID=1714355 RepID=A0A1V2A712_9BACI|nr:D-alanine--D-alanine ligase [Domibacillus epiphyticus]OMP66791.1 D-alanine--D-alanine ligase A [Domibacillus epiphyticus]
MKMKLGLLYGGKSAEHNVSLQTAKAVTAALDLNKFDVYPVYISIDGTWTEGEKLDAPAEHIDELTIKGNGGTEHVLSMLSKGKYDVVFPLLHGPNGEDGTVQGLLEVLNVPYVGNGVLASSAGMDKVIMKNVFAQAGLKQVGYTHMTRTEWETNKIPSCEMIEREIGWPCFVKPANLGSSVGISKCQNKDELIDAMEEAFQFDRKVIIEEGVNAREIEVGILGNDHPACSVIGEIVPKKDFYDYKAKYEDADTALIIPAEITADQKKEMESLAIRAFRSLDCSGLVRADFFLTESGEFLINEVNTMPGFTPFSMFPLLWKEAGVEYPQLIEKMIDLAIERHTEKQKIKYTV